jgi:hypothetical protein
MGPPPPEFLRRVGLPNPTTPPPAPPPTATTQTLVTPAGHTQLYVPGESNSICFAIEGDGFLFFNRLEFADPNAFDDIIGIID